MKHYSYKELDYKFGLEEPLEEFAIKVNWPKPTYSYQTRGPDDLEFYPLDNDRCIVIARSIYHDYDGDSTSISVYLAVPETGEDHDARIIRENDKINAEKEAKSRKRALDKQNKIKSIEDSIKRLEKAGYKVIK